MQQVPYRGPTNIRSCRNKFSGHGDQVPWICGPLVLRLSFSRDSYLHIHSLILSVLCLPTGPHLLPKRFLHTVRSSAFYFSFQYPLFSFISSSSCPRILPRLPVPSTLPCISPSITWFRRQFLRKMWPIQSAFLLFIVCRIFLVLLDSMLILLFSHDRSNCSPSFSSTTFENFPGISDLLSEVSKFL